MLYDALESLADDLLAEPDPVALDGMQTIGQSRDGRPIAACRIGDGPLRVSLIAGCHADEPVGPRLLARLVQVLRRLPADHPALGDLSWWIVPHANPDGAAANAAWQTPRAHVRGGKGDSASWGVHPQHPHQRDASPWNPLSVSEMRKRNSLTELRGTGGCNLPGAVMGQSPMRRNDALNGTDLPDSAAYDLDAYARLARRDLPGEDLEFGFPRDAADTAARPEARAIMDWWRSAGGAFQMHGSLHGMSYAPGPWYLLEASWADRFEPLRQRCAAATAALGYILNPVDRGGEKGFTRLAEGFSTRPDSRAMRDHFLALDDPATAARFRPSSMEAIRSLGGDPLTIVSEMPLFLVPFGLDTRDPQFRLDPAAVPDVVPMPVADQMRLIWTFISAAVELAGLSD